MGEGMIPLWGGRPPRTTWFCPEEGCPYEAFGTHDYPFGDGVCALEHRRRALTKRKPPRG